MPGIVRFVEEILSEDGQDVADIQEQLETAALSRADEAHGAPGAQSARTTPADALRRIHPMWRTRSGWCATSCALPALQSRMVRTGSGLAPLSHTPLSVT
ncbi:hypothetical protein OHU34_03675 [Streptomyces sp. NBC_00080]|uniref:hypothetical protein n=1 Tax=Streptomyces TaxID=1883 RepID=UPI001E609257|nr:hypothetical protein [Streptomyces coriariae]